MSGIATPPRNRYSFYYDVFSYLLFCRTKRVNRDIPIMDERAATVAVYRCLFRNYPCHIYSSNTLSHPTDLHSFLLPIPCQSVLPFNPLFLLAFRRYPTFSLTKQVRPSRRYFLREALGAVKMTWYTYTETSYSSLQCEENACYLRLQHSSANTMYESAFRLE